MPADQTRDVSAVPRQFLTPSVPLGEFHLLAIGIDRYEARGDFAALHTAANDARELVQVLQQHYGFTPARTTCLTDAEATREAIIEQLHALADRLSDHDSLLVYYAGHGWLDPRKGIGYWIPVDGAQGKPATWVPNSVTKEIFRAASARHILLISDSCFAGDFFREGAAPPQITDAYVQMAFARSSRQALTSGGLEPVRDDGAQGHSIFTGFLLRELRESTQPYLVPEDLHQRVRGAVAANAPQQPLLGLLRDTGGEVGGEFVLFRHGGAGQLEEQIRQRRARMTDLERQQQAADQANAAQQAELDAKAQELREVEQRLQELHQRMGQTGSEANELDQLVALVEERERQEEELERLKREAEAARLRREAELERLRQEELVRRKQAFEADLAKYAKVCGSKFAADDIKAKAWEALCRNWRVDAGTPGELEWDGGAVKLRVGPCPLCRKRTFRQDTFRCKECGREWVCNEHHISARDCCHECAAKLAKAEERLEAARLEAGRLQVERMKAERQHKDPANATKEQPWKNSLGMKLVPVPGTKVLFGIWDVRVQDYRAYAKSNSGVDGGWEKPGFAQDDSHPVVNVSWRDAQAFCAWLTRKERAEGKLTPSHSYRLPKDWEWSVAVGLTEAKEGAPKQKDERTAGVYPWGTAWPPPKGAGNYDQSLGVDNYGYTSPVGSFAANQYGLYDMGGNVWQWCEDSYMGQGGSRVLRGGSWGNHGPRELLSSCRYADAPGLRNILHGFRVVLVVAGSVR